MPKKRKVDADEKEDSLNSNENPDDVEVKTERLSQEEVKGSPPPADEEGKRAAGRNLRPRKSTCYAEKDSPDIDFEEKLKKLPRRKRRPTLSEDGSDEKEPKIKRNDKDNEESATPSKNPDSSDVLGNIEPPLPTLVSCSKLNADDGVTGKQGENNNATAVVSTSGGDQLPKATEKKRPRKKPKVKSNPTEELAVDANVVPKTEPVSPSGAPTENKEKQEDTEKGSKKEDPSANAPKPKKKRIRKKPALPPASKTEGQSDEKKSTSGEEPEIKQEVEEGENSKMTTPGENGKEGGEKTKPAAVPRKRPPKKKAKPQVKPDSENPGEAGTKGISSSDPPKEGDGNNDSKSNENGENKPVVAATIPKKRVKSRPKKPAADKTATENEVGNKPGEVKIEAKEKLEEGDEANKKPEDPVNGNDATTAGPAPPPPPTALLRKPFFRGRRSKSISARAGRKEIIYSDEAIDPEDIKGFEHVEKYVAPVGVRLPKFWDSEDEMSEDENNDNFRRIMCGFGTNCRIHEVIRPASEIVRRLKELQNTFGATKSLPLFQKADKTESKEESSISDSNDPFFRKDRPIVWHTDPSFFKYANNYPSKCK